MDLRENDEEAGLKQSLKVVPDRWAGYSGTNPGLQLLDILQESTTILRKHDGVLMTLAFLLAIPVSSLLLSHILLRIPFLEHTVIFLQARLGRNWGTENWRRRFCRGCWTCRYSPRYCKAA